MRHFLFATCFTAVALLSGCASQLATQVSTFNEIPTGAQSLAGRKFAIIPTADQQGSLEFAEYANQVKTALVAKGLVDAPVNSQELNVQIAYGIGPGSIAPAGGGGFSLGSGFGLGGGGVGLGVGFPLGSSAAGSPLYRRSLRLTIDQLPRRAEPAPTPSRLYEATAVSEGRTATLTPVMPAMIAALFEDFPGTSGQSKVVKTPIGNAD